MNSYNSDHDESKSELRRALRNLLVNITSMVPLIGLAFAAAIFISQLFSPSFGFTCKSISVEAARTVLYKHHSNIIRVRPMTQAPPDVNPTPAPIPEQTYETQLQK